MGKSVNYEQKFNSFENNTLFEKLDKLHQQFIREISLKYKFTFQEFRQIVQASRDLSMWGEGDIKSWWIVNADLSDISSQKDKKNILNRLHKYLDQLKKQEKKYPDNGLFSPKTRIPNRIIIDDADKTIHGKCPVASERTVCCKLHTIDAVENCVFGCSYCTIQTFYGKDILIQKDIKQKLDTISIDPNRFYHFGTGQSSDSLAWGNRNGILDALCNFASENPNLLMEFKTKSNNIRYFLETKIPENIVCSWSLNSPVIIENEEHFTAPLEERIASARALADSGIKVAFHFHPLVWYEGWKEDYLKIAKQLQNEFAIHEVLFVSFGSITLIKPVVQKIRDLGNPTKTLQMEFVKDPHGKLTYPDYIKTLMFKYMYDTFGSWQKDVFFYLCMEKTSIWEESFGYVYQSNDEFEREFGIQTMKKINNYPEEPGENFHSKFC
jgi:spore photoproduct lyase